MLYDAKTNMDLVKMSEEKYDQRRASDVEDSYPLSAARNVISCVVGKGTRVDIQQNLIDPHEMWRNVNALGGGSSRVASSFAHEFSLGGSQRATTTGAHKVALPWEERDWRRKAKKVQIFIPVEDSSREFVAWTV
jgi:hypothetical protein